MLFTEKIVIPPKDAAEADFLLSPCGVPSEDQSVDKRCETCLLRDFPTKSWTACFPNGNEVDVKLCPGCTPWAEAVLFNSHGVQIAYTEPDDTLFGEWELEEGDDQYLVVVARGDM